MWYLNKKTGLRWDINESDKDLIKRLDDDKNYEKVSDKNDKKPLKK